MFRFVCLELRACNELSLREVLELILASSHHLSLLDNTEFIGNIRNTGFWDPWEMQPWPTGVHYTASKGMQDTEYMVIPLSYSAYLLRIQVWNEIPLSNGCCVAIRKLSQEVYVAVWDLQDRQKNRSVCTLTRSLLLCSLLLSITINLHRPGVACQHHLLFYWSSHTSSLYRDLRLASQ